MQAEEIGLFPRFVVDCSRKKVPRYVSSDVIYTYGIKVKLRQLWFSDVSLSLDLGSGWGEGSRVRGNKSVRVRGKNIVNYLVGRTTYLV